jgi:hypothetical protein
LTWVRDVLTAWKKLLDETTHKAKTCRTPDKQTFGMDKEKEIPAF